MEKIALDILSDYISTDLGRTVLAYHSIPNIHKVLRKFAQPGIESTSGVSYIVSGDPDLGHASAIVDVSASEAEADDPLSMPFYEFELSDDKGTKKSYKFVVYRLKFKPIEKSEIDNQLVNIDGDVKQLSAEDIYRFLEMGQADKFVAGVENKEDSTERFNYSLLHLEIPVAKKAFVLEDDGNGKVRPQSQIQAVTKDYSNYLSILKSKVSEYNTDIGFRITKRLQDKKLLDEPPAPPAPPGGAMPGMPPMGGAPMPPM